MCSIVLRGLRHVGLVAEPHYRLHFRHHVSPRRSRRCSWRTRWLGRACGSTSSAGSRLYSGRLVQGRRHWRKSPHHSASKSGLGSSKEFSRSSLSSFHEVLCHLPAGQDFFNRSLTRLLFLTGRVVGLIVQTRWLGRRCGTTPSACSRLYSGRLGLGRRRWDIPSHRSANKSWLGSSKRFS